jgi:hypothetical protein
MSAASPRSSTWAASQWTGRTATLRVLQVTEGGFRPGPTSSGAAGAHEVIDCDARTIAHAGFGSIRAGGRKAR